VRKVIETFSRPRRPERFGDAASMKKSREAASPGGTFLLLNRSQFVCRQPRRAAARAGSRHGIECVEEYFSSTVTFTGLQKERFTRPYRRRGALEEKYIRRRGYLYVQLVREYLADGFALLPGFFDFRLPVDLSR